MAVWVANDYANLISVDEPSRTCVYFLVATWHGNTTQDAIDRIRFDGTGFGWQWGLVTQYGVDGTYYTSLAGNPTFPCDQNTYWRGNVRSWQEGRATIYAAYSLLKTTSVTASTSNPSVGSITANSASVSCNYFPNTFHSTCSAQLQYKKTTESAAFWSNFGDPAVTSGYAQQNITQPLTGLSGLTSYDVRLVLTRTTADKQSATSSASSFQTLPGIPEITTNNASGVAATSAVLNASLINNAGTSVNVYWKYGTDNPPTQNTTANVPSLGDGPYSIQVVGLSSGLSYFAKAYASFLTPSGSPVSGSVVNFNTPTDPLAEAAAEAHVIIREFNERKYGVASKFVFTVASPATTSSDRFFNSASPFVAGDVQVAQDTGSGLGSFTNVTSLPTRIGSTPAFELDLSATEMQGKTVVVLVVDQNGPAFRDMMFVIRTYQELGAVDVDASQLSNVSAMKLTGQGTGHGLEAIGGATGNDIDGILALHYQRVSSCQTNANGNVIKLDASASATNDYYNGSIAQVVAGTGAGQARIITDYDGTTKEATVDTAWATIPTAGSLALISGGSRAWDLSPDAELATVPGSTANYGLKLQFLFQRFAFKITQTATLQTWFKSNSSTALASRAVDDDGVTQLLSKLT